MDLINLSWPEVAALSKNTPVVIPVAALEQHGRHLPIFADSMLLGEVVGRVKKQLEHLTEIRFHSQPQKLPPALFVDLRNLSPPWRPLKKSLVESAKSPRPLRERAGREAGG